MIFSSSCTRRAARLIAAATVASVAPSGAGLAQEGAIGIELNKVEDTEEGCRTLFVFENRTGHELNRFRVDLILFDDEGVFSRQLMLDMAPLYDEKKSVASFLLEPAGCGQIGSILVNDIPQCENGTGTDLDCVDLLEVSSRSDIPLEK
ncbi:MAG: Tat pathway signal sequence domain protein [Geminicoccaceae bacterium]|nr:Tat pathway signal sequence domain protein [Geminicoccaceae bacterium]